MAKSTKGSSEANFLEVFRLYRCLQLLETLTNVTFRNIYIPGEIFGASAAVITALYICIKLSDKIPMPGFGFFPSALMDGCMILFIELASSGFVFSKSEGLLDDFKRMGNFKKKTGVNAMMKGLPPLKIRFGMNYMDQFTTLTLADFCINQTASLLLMVP